MSKSLKIGDLEVKIPVVQGGMGVGISLSGLAGNVSACGGLGVISTAQIGWREPDFYEKPFEANFRAIEKEIKKARELAKGGVLGVNIMVATQRYEEYVKSAVKAGIDIVISGAGLPIDLPKYVEGSKTKIAPIVSSLKSLTVICRMWERKYQTAPDLVVIEGPKAGGHLGFSREELETVTDEAYDDVIVSIIEKVKEETVTTLLVNENWFSDYKTEINGENISSKNIDNRDKVAIIGSSLALKLFFITDAVGKKICIDGNQYTICGVICENESLINKFSVDDKQRVYVPYTTSENYGDRTVDMIVYYNSVYTGAIVEQMDLPQYYSVNLNDKNQTLSSFEHILYLAIFIGFSIIALKLWYRFSRKFFEEIKENLKLNYFLKSLKNIPLKYVALVLVFAGIPAVLLIVFNICDFSIFISSKYIPNDNIFDLSNYLNVLVDNAQTLNSQSLTGNPMLVNLFSRTFTASLWLTIIFLISIITVLLNFTELKLHKHKNTYKQ